MKGTPDRKPNGLPDTHLSSPGDRRRTPRQERSKITVEAILGAASLLLVEKGLSGASTNAIAKKAGVSIGSLYQYFPNKDSIFLALLERHHQEMQPIKVQAVRDLADGRPAELVLNEVLRKSFDVRRRNPELMTAMNRELAGLAAKHELEGSADSGDIVDVLARVLQSREDLAGEHIRERAFLVITILEAVGRRMVHGRISEMDQDALFSMTVDACRDLLG